MSLVAGALRHRQHQRAGLRRALVRQGRDAGGDAGHVVHRGAGAGLGRVADVRQTRLAVRRRAHRLHRGYLPWFADIDRQMYFFSYATPMAPFLVILDHADPGRHPVSQIDGTGTTHARAAGRVLLRRAWVITNFA